MAIEQTKEEALIDHMRDELNDLYNALQFDWKSSSEEMRCVARKLASNTADRLLGDIQEYKSDKVLTQKFDHSPRITGQLAVRLAEAFGLPCVHPSFEFSNEDGTFYIEYDSGADYKQEGYTYENTWRLTTKTLEKELTELKEEVRHCEKHINNTVEACAFMHDDKSLGLLPGDRLSVEGVKALQASRDEWRDLCGEMVGHIHHESFPQCQLRKKFNQLKGQEELPENDKNNEPTKQR